MLNVNKIGIIVIVSALSLGTALGDEEPASKPDDLENISSDSNNVEAPELVNKPQTARDIGRDYEIKILESQISRQSEQIQRLQDTINRIEIKSSSNYTATLLT